MRRLTFCIIVLLLTSIVGCYKIASTETDSDTAVDKGTGADADTDTDMNIESDPLDTTTDTDTDPDLPDTSTDSDADMDTDTDADTDTDTATDTDTDTDTDCLTDEIQQPSTNLNWLRCPLGQTWDASSCSCTGTAASMDWCDASGETSTFCTPDNPGTNICKSTFGAGYRLPNVDEYRALLEIPDGSKWGSECDSGDGGTMCTEKFGPDGYWYWSSSSYDDYYAWFAYFDNGLVNPYHKALSSTSSVSVVCVRDRDW